MLKKYTILWALLMLSSTSQILLSSGCNKRSDDCSGVEICTEVYVTIGFTLLDKSGKNIQLDSLRSFIKSSNKLLPSEYERNTAINGFHAIVADRSIGMLEMKGTELYVEGYLDGIIKVNSDYNIGHDCCHVIKNSGKDTIILN